MDDIRRNALIIFNQVISPDKLLSLVNDEEYLCRVYDWVCRSDIGRLGNILPNPGRHKDQLSLDFLHTQLEKAEKNSIRIITCLDDEYPERLKNIYQPPPVVYIRNSLIKSPSLGVVGTRKATPYGKNAVSHIIPGLVSQGVSIISGMAYGIDYYAHRVCLENGGYTAAVLGTGMDIVYPSQNQALYDMIIKQNSCLVSEYPLGYTPTRYSFLQRNRIISGLSDGILVVESKERGGALSTANFALEQGKDVFSIPGSIFSLQSAGCNNLIKQGAVPVTDHEDILFAMRNNINIQEAFKETKKETRSITEEEALVLELMDMGITGFESLMDRLSFDIGYLYNLLFDLERKGYIRREAGNRYLRIICKGDN